MVAITVEVVLALPGRCWTRSVTLAEGATAGQAVTASGLADVCLAETGAAPARLGIYGRKISPDTALQAGQRVELYRPLQIDPRQRRAERARTRRGGGQAPD